MSTIPEEFRDDLEALAEAATHAASRDGGSHVERILVTDAARRLLAALPEPEPTFTDEEALAFDRAMWPNTPHPNVTMGRKHLTTLAKAGWTAPKALCPSPSPAVIDSDCSACGASNADCLEGIDKGGRSCCLTCYRTDTHTTSATPPSSPALVELVEAARVHVAPGDGCFARLRAAVAAYDEQEGTA